MSEQQTAGASAPAPMTPETPAGSARLDPEYLTERDAWGVWLHAGGYDSVKFSRTQMSAARLAWHGAWVAAQAPALYAVAARLIAWYDRHCDPAMPPDEHAACALRALVDEARRITEQVEEEAA